MSASDLTTLSQVQAWGGSAVNGADSQIAALIPATSDQILGILGRQSALPYLYTDSLSGQGGRGMFLRQYPVQSIASLAIDGNAISAATPGAPGGQGWLLDPPDPFPPGRPQRVSLRGYWGFSRGYDNVAISYIAGYQTKETVTVDANGFAKLAQPLGVWGNDQGVMYASGAALTPVASSPAPGQYVPSGPTYAFNSADVGVAVVISYGYIPQALAMACAQWIVESVSYSTRIGLKSKVLGGQETIVYDISPIPGRSLAMLQPFKRVLPI